MTDEITEELKKSGVRITPARKALLTEFEATSVPLSAETLGKRLMKRRIPTDRATVYRELRFLERLGIVESVRLGSRREYFEKKRHHHHHAVCVSCETVFDIELDERTLNAAEERLRSRERFSVLRHTLDFFGVCDRCRRGPCVKESR